MKKQFLVTLVLLLTTQYLEGTVVIQGNDPDAPRGFLTAITTQVYDRLRGTFYVGLAAGSDRFGISCATRPTFSGTQSFSPVLGAMSSLLTASIEFLAFSQQTTTLPVLLAVPEDGGGPLLTNMVTGLFTDGSHETQTASLNDATGSASTGIVNIAASSFHLFAAVKPNTAASSFGDAGSGIALVNINPSANALTLTVKDATTGLNGNLAQALDNSSTVVVGNQGGSNVMFTAETPPLFWDEQFERLYIGISLQTGGGAANDIGKSIVVGRLAGNALQLNEIVSDNAIAAASTDELVVLRAVQEDLFVRHIRVVHTTTGPDYLIINGGNGTAMTTSNTVFALPLVNDPSNPTIHGTLADKDAPLANFVFTQPATTPGELATSLDAAAIVGSGPLPIAADTTVADMVVVDDAVYVSIAQTSTSVDGGIFYSQAIFDNDGKVGRWTPWTKRAAPFNAFGPTVLPSGTLHNGPVSFFEVDAKIGTIWIVEGETNQLVGVTSWGSPTTANSLPDRVNVSLATGSYSALDLDQATRGFLDQTIHRYALFGGTNKVAFARISQAADITSASSPQEVILDFSTPENFLDTFLPAPGGCVQALDYSRTSTSDGQQLNYFYAGTENGLFAFADASGTGFNSNELSTLNLPPFSTGSWQTISSITGSVVDIKTSGAGAHTVYVLSQEPTSSSPLAATLYAIPMMSTLSAMFDPGNVRILAQTGVGVFSGVTQFYGIQIIATGAPITPENKEQLVLATNQGLFRSFADQNGAALGMTEAANQTAANWQLVPNTQTTFYFGVAGMDTPVRQTVWPFSLTNKDECLTFEQGMIQQTSGNGASSGNSPVFTLSFVPEQFNANPLLPSLQTLDPITFFFSDGGRRFFIFNNLTTPPTQNQIGVLPYFVTPWAVGEPTILSFGSLQTPNRFYWIMPIGASGFIMAGTGTGVTALS